ncbi:hypothetical protein B0H13DRAFT_1860717, partial [Mycena leptocephala]
ADHWLILGPFYYPGREQKPPTRYIGVSHPFGMNVPNLCREMVLYQPPLHSAAARFADPASNFQTGESFALLPAHLATAEWSGTQTQTEIEIDFVACDTCCEWHWESLGCPLMGGAKVERRRVKEMGAGRRSLMAYAKPKPHALRDTRTHGDSSASLEGWCTAREVLMQTLSDDAPDQQLTAAAVRRTCGRKSTVGHGSLAAMPARPWLVTLAVFRIIDNALHFLKVSRFVGRRWYKWANEVQEWTGVAWQTATLAEIGLVYQLGHRGLNASRPLKLYTQGGLLTWVASRPSTSSSAAVTRVIGGRPARRGWLGAFFDSDEPCGYRDALGVRDVFQTRFGSKIVVFFRFPLLKLLPRVLKPHAPCNARNIRERSRYHPWMGVSRTGTGYRFSGTLAFEPLARWTSQWASTKPTPWDTSRLIAASTFLTMVSDMQNSVECRAEKRRLTPGKLNDPLANWVPVPDEDDGIGEDTLNDMDRSRARKKGNDAMGWATICLAGMRALRQGTRGLSPETPDSSGAKIAGISAVPVVLREKARAEPVHLLKEWTGNFGNRELGIVGHIYQLGHQGRPCSSPAPLIRTMVVLDITGSIRCVFNIVAQQPATTFAQRVVPSHGDGSHDVRDVQGAHLFRLLNVVGNMNVHDFIGTLERLTDGLVASGMNWLRIPAKGVGAGRAHDPAGIEATKLGELTVVCWACPRRVAISPEWRDVDPKYSNERSDPSLGPGWGAFVEPNEYKEHLRNYVGETDVMADGREQISTCIAFAALLQKDSRLTTGLRTSGVGGRNAKLPERIRLDLSSVEVQCGLPVWHASSHEVECSNENSLSFLVGVGKSDGEGVERTWADLNPASFHTKEMGVGNRADTLEDKNLNEVDALRRKLLVAIAERQRQVDSFSEVNKTVGKDVRKVWQAAIDAFVKDHEQPNPYMIKTAESRIRLELKEAEEEEARKAGRPIHGTSATAFLVAGIQLEDAQRRIVAELAGHALVTADRASKINDRRRTFFQKLQKFRRLQEIFTPGAARAVAAEEAVRDPDAPPKKAEEVRLYMPSDLPAWEQKHGCQRGVVAIESALRDGQCESAMIAIRSGLHTKRHLIGFRNTQVTGQVKATKARTLIAQVGERVDANAAKYRQGRKALQALVGEDDLPYLDHRPHCRELKPSHLTLANEEIESDTAARKKLSLLSAGKGARTPRHITGSSKHVLSWIWMVNGGPITDAKHEEEIHASMRVEWCRAKARKVRWEEEVLLLREEMRRVLRYLDWEAETWKQRASARENESLELRQGLKAYALRHEAQYRDLAAFFKAEWNVSVGEAATAVVRETPEDGADLVQLFDGDGAVDAE